MATFVYFGLATMAMFFPYVYLEFLSGKNLTTTYPYEDSDFFYNFVVEQKVPNGVNYDQTRWAVLTIFYGIWELFVGVLLVLDNGVFWDFVYPRVNQLLGYWDYGILADIFLIVPELLAMLLPLMRFLLIDVLGELWLYDIDYVMIIELSLTLMWFLLIWYDVAKIV